jgi:hypothetical protein
MKFFTPSLFLMLFGFAAFAQTDTITNGGFESWSRAGANYFDAAGWVSPDDASGGAIVVVGPDSTSPHAGHYCAKLKTGTIAGYMVPGFVTNGQIDVTNQNIVGGVQIHSRPLAVQGWYEYTPSGSDTGTFSVTIRDASRTVIGTGSLDVSAAQSSWTFFSVPVTYTSGAMGDTSLVSLFSSGYHGTVGSVMFVDDVSYSYTTGIHDDGTVDVKVYPNPVNNVEFFGIDNSLELKNAVVKFYNVMGQEVKSSEITSHSFAIDTRNLPIGYYTFNLINDGKLAGTGKIEVQR